MDMPDWATGFPGAVTVSDRNHVIVWLNDKAARTFAKDGGKALVGRDLMACHNPRSRAVIERILATGEPNAYTIEKAGVKKVIYQAPWRDASGAVAGLVELSLEVPFDLPHFVRDAPPAAP